MPTTLPQETIDRISNEAIDYYPTYPIMGNDIVAHNKAIVELRTAYKLGATAEATRAIELVNALEKALDMVRTNTDRQFIQQALTNYKKQ